MDRAGGGAPSAKRNVLLLTLVFSPDGVSTSILLSELTRRLHLLGHRIRVLTTTPHYNNDADLLSAQPLEVKIRPVLYQSRFHGVPVLHARMRAKGKRILSRLFDYVSFHVITTIAGLALREKIDLVLAPSPPLTIGLSAAVIAAFRRAPFVYNVQEIYPDIAVSLGVLKNRALIRLLQGIENQIYARAEAVVVISENFRKRLIAKGVPEKKLSVIPNFVDIDFIRPGNRHNPFSIHHGLEESFVVLYAGNIGLTQDIETVAAAAERLRQLPAICFLFVGDGARRHALAEEIARRQLTNIRMLPYQPNHVVPDLYATSDVCLVPMRRNTGFGTFPSKVYTIMAAGRPSVVCAESDSELAEIVLRAECGVIVAPEDPAALAGAIVELYRDGNRREAMATDGRKYVVENHSPGRVAALYDKLISDISDRWRRYP